MGAQEVVEFEFTVNVADVGHWLIGGPQDSVYFSNVCSVLSENENSVK